MTPKKPTLASNITWLYGLQGMNYLGAIVLLPYLVRVLGVEQYGLVAFAQSIAQYFIIATDYGFNFSATRRIAQNRDNAEEVARIFWTVNVIKLGLLALGAVCLGLLVVYVPRFQANPGIYFAAYVAVVGNAIFPVWLFQGMERMRSIAVITGLAKLLSVVLVLALVHHRGDALLATLLQSAGFLVAGIIGTIVALRHHISAFHRPRRNEIRTAIVEGRHLFVSTAAISMYSNTNTFLVGLLAGNVQVGYFSLADKFIRAVTGLAGPGIQAAYPHMISLLARSRERAIQFIRTSLLTGAALTGVFGIVILAFAPALAKIAFGHNAPAVVPLIRLLAPFPLLGVLNYILGTLVLIPFGFDKLQSRILLSVGVVNIALASVLIPRQGAFGGAISIIVMEFLQLAVMLVFITRQDIRLFGKLLPVAESV